MSGPGERPRGRRRALTAEEESLWQTVTQSVKPLRGRKRGTRIAPEKSPATTEVMKASPVKAEPARKSAPPKPPPLAPLQRREKQRLARGSASPDARLDLHGMTQERAHRALTRFLHAAQADGAKLVLVITGKGARTSAAPGEERGVLRRLVPQWLALAEFRSLVVGFEPAHITHGGEGALYVRVRRGR